MYIYMQYPLYVTCLKLYHALGCVCKLVRACPAPRALYDVACRDMFGISTVGRGFNPSLHVPSLGIYK